MPAPVTIDEAVGLSEAQQKALALAALTLPDSWRVVVNAEDQVQAGDRFSVRILGDVFTTLSGFAARAHPDQLSAFIERTRRGRNPQR